MYNGIGLSTVRGSGTNGHVQRNLSFIKLAKERVHIQDDDMEKLEAMLSRKGNEEILEHERKRQVEIKCLELEETLLEQGYESDEVQVKVDAFRAATLGNPTDGEKGTKGVSGKSTLTETHAVAEATAAKNEMFRHALGLANEGDSQEDPAAEDQQDDPAKSGDRKSKKSKQPRKKESEPAASSKKSKSSTKQRRSRRHSSSISESEPELSDEPDSPTNRHVKNSDKKHTSSSSGHKHSSRKHHHSRSRSHSKDRKHNKHTSSSRRKKHRKRFRHSKSYVVAAPAQRGTGKKVGLANGVHGPVEAPPHIIVLGTVIYGHDYTSVAPPKSYSPKLEWIRDYFWDPKRHNGRWQRAKHTEQRRIAAARSAKKRRKKLKRAAVAVAEVQAKHNAMMKSAKIIRNTVVETAVSVAASTVSIEVKNEPVIEIPPPPASARATVPVMNQKMLRPLPPLSPLILPTPGPAVSPPPRRKRSSPHFSERRRITSARKKPVCYEDTEVTGKNHRRSSTSTSEDSPPP